MTSDFDSCLEMGEVAVEWVHEELVRDRWLVIRHDKLPPEDDHGPRSTGRGGELTLPDLQATKHGKTIAVEVKGKTTASDGRISGEPEHGIDERLYDDYVDYDRQMPTFIVIVELGPSWNGRDTYAARISELRPRLSHSGGMPPMMYWPRSQMAPDWLLRLNRYVTQSTNHDIRRRRA
jgi:hypothetical protein